MIVTSNGFRAVRFAWPISAFSHTGGRAAQRQEILQRRTAKTLTVPDF
jgi:hypothetical protein